MDYMRLLRVLPRDSRTSPVIAFPRTRPDYQTLSNNHLNFLCSQPRLRSAATSDGWVVVGSGAIVMHHGTLQGPHHGGGLFTERYFHHGIDLNAQNSTHNGMPNRLGPGL